ncbi:MAG: phosphonate ABC transporter ATP-binding protein [Brevinematales bacterium]|nr:phosphonate ABC transporter ATP-binding protein [Brevinematales bacterium]
MLKFNNIHKKFGEKEVLKGINLEIKEGEFVAIIGASGCGKTTLIRTVNGFVIPDAGEVYLDNEKINYSDSNKLRKMRKKVGMVYQLFNLVERTNSLQNVLNGTLGSCEGFENLLSILGIFKKEKIKKALEYLDYVGLKDSIYDRADKRSGGQKQRVAIARALMQHPSLLLADEPIANLDPTTSHKILSLLKKINEETKLTTVVVIHHIDFVKSYFKRIVAMKNGVIVYDGNYDGLTEEKLHFIYSEHLDEIYSDKIRAEQCITA